MVKWSGSWTSNHLLLTAMGYMNHTRNFGLFHVRKLSSRLVLFRCMLTPEIMRRRTQEVFIHHKKLEKSPYDINSVGVT